MNQLNSIGNSTFLRNVSTPVNITQDSTGNSSSLGNNSTVSNIT